MLAWSAPKAFAIASVCVITVVEAMAANSGGRGSGVAISEAGAAAGAATGAAGFGGATSTARVTVSATA